MLDGTERERDKGVREKEVGEVITDAYLDFLAQLSGFAKERIDPERGGLGMYGIDSLSGVSCQYWFHRGESLLPPSFLPISLPSRHYCDPVMGIVPQSPLVFFLIGTLRLPVLKSELQLTGLIVAIELAIDIPVTKILGAGTIAQIVEEVVKKLDARGHV